MFSKKNISTKLPQITAEDIKSTLDSYTSAKKGFFSGPTSLCIQELEKIYANLINKAGSISDNAMIELVGLWAKKDLMKNSSKTATALIPLESKFRREFLFIIAYYKEYLQYITIDELRAIYKNPDARLVGEYNKKNAESKKQNQESMIAGAQPHGYAQIKDDDDSKDSKEGSVLLASAQNKK